MSIQYVPAPEIEEQVWQIAAHLDMKHIDTRVRCVRSVGSKSRWTLARCHAMSKVFPTALEMPMHYVIEVITETYDKLCEVEKTKTLIHEMLHIPRNFGGGLKSHKYVTDARVDKLYEELVKIEALTQRVDLDRYLA